MWSGREKSEHAKIAVLREGLTFRGLGVIVHHGEGRKSRKMRTYKRYDVNEFRAAKNKQTRGLYVD